MSEVIKITYWNPILCKSIVGETSNQSIAKLFIQQSMNGETVMHMGYPIVSMADTYDCEALNDLKIRKGVTQPDTCIVASDLMMLQLTDFADMILSTNGATIKKFALLVSVCNLPKNISKILVGLAVIASCSTGNAATNYFNEGFGDVPREAFDYVMFSRLYKFPDNPSNNEITHQFLYWKDGISR